MFDCNFNQRRMAINKIDDIQKAIISLKSWCSKMTDVDSLDRNLMASSDLLQEIKYSIDKTIPKNILIVYGKNFSFRNLDVIKEKVYRKFSFGAETNSIVLYNDCARYSYWDDPVQFIKHLPIINALVFADDEAASDGMVMSLVGVVVTSYEPLVYKWEYKSNATYDKGEIVELERGKDANE